MEAKVLLAGESWVSASTHFMGFDFFSSTYYAIGGDFLIAACPKEFVDWPGYSQLWQQIINWAAAH
jgi:uncharacterized membrane protein